MIRDFLIFFAGHYNYIVSSILVMIGFYILISHGHFIKKIVGLNLFQNGVFLFYISLGKVQDGTIPILLEESGRLYSNPLPHVLILTAIVVGVSTMAMGLALCVRIHDSFGSVEEDDVLESERQDEMRDARNG